MNFIKKNKLTYIIILTFILLVCSICTFFSYTKPLVINEICTNNQTIISIDDNCYYNWIEIYNPNNKSICLDDYYISNDKNELNKFKFIRNVYLGAHDYIVVYFNEGYTGENWLVASFNINLNDKYIYLSNKKGKIVSQIENVKLEPDTSYGYFDKKLQVLNPSPNKKNIFIEN